MAQDRRKFIQQLGISFSVLAASSIVGGTFASAKDVPHRTPPLSPDDHFPFSLPELPYALGDLEPWLDAQTLSIHHGKHHQGYVNKLNDALKAFPAHQEKPLSQLMREAIHLPQALQTAVRKHAGGHFNHTLYWSSFAPGGRNLKENDPLSTAINRDFGSMDTLGEMMVEEGGKVFGSGWVWLVVKNDGSLILSQSANQENPLMPGAASYEGIPILGIDVWEHAYYLRYQNQRTRYLKEAIPLVNWPVVAQRFRTASQG